MFRPLKIEFEMLDEFSMNIFIPEYDYSLNVIRQTQSNGLPLDMIINLFLSFDAPEGSIISEIKNDILFKANFELDINGIIYDPMYHYREDVIDYESRNWS